MSIGNVDDDDDFLRTTLHHMYGGGIRIYGAAISLKHTLTSTSAVWSQLLDHDKAGASQHGDPAPE